MKTVYLKNFVTHVLLVTVCLLLVQCQNLFKTKTYDVGSEPSFKNSAQRDAALKKYKQWQADGKIGLTYPYRGKRKAITANIDWFQDNQNFDMSFSGPLGMGGFTIEKRPSKTVLTDHKGRQYTASSPESLMDKHTGIPIPWSDLVWWVRALPAPDKPHEKQFMPDALHMEKLEQSGWVIDYLEYSNYENFLLPGKIKFSNGEINATVIVHNWKLIK